MTVSINFEGSFAAAGMAIKAEIDELITTTGEAVRQGAEDRSRYDANNDEPGHIHMKDAWVFINEGDQAGSVFNDVEYTKFNEFGTVKMPAQPMLRPAVDAAAPEFYAKLKQLIGAD